MISVFLSASVPLPDRDPQFITTADIVAIRESIKALVAEVAPRGYLVFGGHPAITPLIALLLKNSGNEMRKRVILYQSEYFADQYEIENDQFLELRVVAAVKDSRKRSIAAMRRRMIQESKFDAGVFIGGMEGVVEEFNLFRKFHSNAPAWPIASTGAAARQIFEKDPNTPSYLFTELTYSTLFRRLLNEL